MFRKLIARMMHDSIIKRGDKLTYRITQHGSVGLWEKVDFDERYFDCDTESNYKCPPERRDMPGGDGIDMTVVLTAKKRGRTEVTKTSDFRGEINVEKKKLSII